MPWLISNWRIVVVAALALGTLWSGYRAGASNTQQKWDTERQAQVSAHLAAVEKNQKTITDLEIKHAKATTALEHLRANPAGRVRLPPTIACPDLPNTASGVAVSITGTERASNPAQDALGEAQQGMESDAIEWARALNACQVVMDWAQGLGK